MNHRRDAIRTLLGTGAVLAVLPRSWTKPIVNAVIVPAHAQTSCSGFTTEVVNEAISISVTATEVQGPIVVARSTGNTFTGSETSRLDACQGGQDLNVSVEFSGAIDVVNNEIVGDLTIVQRCGTNLVCEQISTYVATQSPVNPTSELGTYVGNVVGTLRCCDDFA